jgi:hypothetical protein
LAKEGNSNDLVVSVDGKLEERQVSGEELALIESHLADLLKAMLAESDEE